mgnify:CR=1 FL=1
MTAQTPHPFSRFVAILGRGKTKQRHLTFDEAYESMGMILRGEVLPEQLGAFLMLLRLKEEGPDEIAGFAAAAKSLYDLPENLPIVDIDWSSYAGKRIQLPWFVLSAMSLVNAGYSMTMHGTEGHTPGRLYTREIIEMFGLPIASSLTEAANQVRGEGFSYIPLEVLSPRLRELIDLRPIFGLRSPVHTFSRMLNPFNADTMMQGIFHRGFMDIHAGAAQTLGQPRMAVFRGEGGEIERRPNKPTPVWMTHGQDEPIFETWPQQLENGHQPPDEVMDTSRLLNVWQDKSDDRYAVASVIGTIAVTLRAMGKAGDIETAEAMAKEVWGSRDKGFLPRT